MQLHSNDSDSRTDSSKTRNKNVPTLQRTGHGYKYVRCQAGDSDDTVYIHQLCAILGGEDPYDVFSDAYDVHHLPLDEWLDLDEHAPPLKDLNTPACVELRPRWQHRSGNLKNRADD